MDNAHLNVHCLQRLEWIGSRQMDSQHKHIIWGRCIYHIFNMIELFIWNGLPQRKMFLCFKDSHQFPYIEGCRYLKKSGKKMDSDPEKS